ncbi:hypothetical protein MUP06_00660 [Patescibacteria group bacterium]|jgi:hypothetical protein|nr:hypothetical protein [Patescibacteria group bacterium]
MPKKLERELKKQAIKKGFAKKVDGYKLTKRGRAYVYGTLRKTGWKPKKQR